MQKVLIATGNAGKLAEFKVFLPAEIEVVSYKELGVPPPEIEETGDTFEANAYLKAITVAEMFQLPTIADDSGLVVDALDGAPGIYSARYSGAAATDESNNAKLLTTMEGISNRAAYFHATIAFFDPQTKKRIHSDGRLSGTILTTPRGKLGFGYDPLFEVEGLNKTLAELDSVARKPYSHRAKALRTLIVPLLKYWGLQNG